MNNMKKISMNAMASLALFRQLYKEERTDVLSVLAEFIKKTISWSGKKAFSVTEIKNKLMEDYEFYIPDSIIASALKKFCQRANNSYQLNADALSEPCNDIDVFETQKTENEKILSDLIAYVECKMDTTLNQQERELLMQSFCEYLIEDKTGEKYSEYIASFMIEQEKNEENHEQLKKIKEGVVLYAGIKYNDQVGNLGGWNTELTIYVEQEILFSLAGYHGELLQEIYMDFLGLIKEINMKASKSLIQIKYFKDVKSDVDNYFDIAEDIVKGTRTLNTSKQAMISIVTGCKSAVDVVRKKVDFYQFLLKNNIMEEKQVFDVIGNEQYNIESADVLTKLNKEWIERDEEGKEEKILRSLKYLNYISIARHGKEGSINVISSILLTQTTRTLFIATHPLIKNGGICPLATNVDYLTNLFWLKLNKGFGKTQSYPKSFDYIIRAKVVLSSLITQSISNEFERIKKECGNGDRLPDAYLAELAELKMRMRRPDDISAENIDESLATIKMTDIEKIIREKQIAQRKAEEKELESAKTISQLRDANEEKNKTIASMQQKMEKTQSDFKELKEKFEEQARSDYDQMKRRKEKADQQISRRIFYWKVIIALLLIFIYILVTICVKKSNWDVLEPVTYVIGLAPLLLGYIVFIFTEKKFSPKQQIISFLKGKKQKYEQDLYEEKNIDLKKLEEYEKNMEKNKS